MASSRELVDAMDRETKVRRLSVKRKSCPYRGQTMRANHAKGTISVLIMPVTRGSA